MVDRISVRVGDHSIKNETDCETIKRVQRCNPPVQDLFVEEVIPHPEYNPVIYKNDIGLLRVSTMNFDVGKSQTTDTFRIDIKKTRFRKRTACLSTSWT